MAGSFGYEAEHYDTSIAMAELSLMPAVRKAPADALIVADGTSCRHQIADGSEPPGGTRRRGAGSGPRAQPLPYGENMRSVAKYIHRRRDG